METPWEALLAMCQGATRATIAAPYIKSRALRELIHRLTPGATIECFTRWNPEDILRGSSDTSCRTVVKEQRGEFYLHKKLHAKYYRFDDRILIGSANITDSGLSFPRPGNLEILCEPGKSFDADEFERTLRAEAHIVSDEEFEIWLFCPAAPQVTPIDSTSPDEDPLYTWRPSTRFPEHLWLSYTNRETEIPSQEQRLLARTDLQALKLPIGLDQSQFENWIRASLLAAPIVDVVKAVTNQPHEEAWRLISAHCGIPTREAERTLSTTQYWIAQFESERST